MKWKVLDFTCHGYRVSADGGCEAVVTARTECWQVMFMECDKLVNGNRFLLKLKG